MSTQVNWSEGLRRIGAAFWGLLALVVLGFFAYFIWEGSNERAPMVGYMIGAAFLFAAGHRLTCWIIDGFSSRQ
jgi:hypothetical protein